MNDKKDKRAIGALIIGACVGFVLAVILLALRVSGYTDMHWALVLTGFSWLTWLVYALMGLAALLVYRGMKVWRWWRLRNCREVRINAEDLRRPGETDEQLRERIYRLVADLAVLGSIRCVALGGTKLDELAREDYNTTRLPGESDEELRHRLLEMVDHKHADKPAPLGGEELDMRAWEDFRLRRKPGETDEQLRARCINEADNELLNQLRETDELWRAQYMNEWYTNEANKEAEI